MIIVAGEFSFEEIYGSSSAQNQRLSFISF